MIFRPDIKPPMWGPPEAVQYAVRANAERMGINPLNVRMCTPAFEGGGLSLTNYGTASSFALSADTTFEPGGCLFDGTDESSVTDTGLLLDLNATILAKITLIGSSLDSRVFSSSNAATGGYKGLSLSAYGVNGSVSLMLGGSGTTYASTNRRSTASTNNYLQLGKSHSVAASPTTFTGAADLWVDGNKCSTTTSGSASSFSAGSGPSRIGSLYTGTWSYSNFILENLIIISEKLTENVVKQFTDTPYALIVPVSRPVYFYLGAGGVTFSASCGSTLSSSDIQASIARRLAASAAASLTSSDVSVTTAASYLLSAACHASASSSDILASILRNLTADGSASTTSSDSSLNIARTLSCDCNGVVSASDAVLTIAGLLVFMAECAASTTGSDVTASIARVLSADSTVSVASSDISVFNLITLAATCNSSASAADVALNLRMYLQAVCDGTLSADDASVRVAALLSAACGAVVSSRDILVLFTDEIVLPELLDAFSRITTSLDGFSHVTTTLDGFSRIDRSTN